MKKLLTLFIPILLPISFPGFANQPKHGKDINQNIVWNLNINESKSFPSNGYAYDGLVGGKLFTFNFLKYASNINNFIAKYPHFIFSNNNYLKIILYKNNKEISFNSIYNSNLLNNSKNLFNILKSNYISPNLNNTFQLATEFAVNSSNQLCFGINYDSLSFELPNESGYSVKINSLTFLTS